MEPTPREEVDYVSLYGELLSVERALEIECYDSSNGSGQTNLGRQPVARLPFPPEQSGYSWMERLERASERLPRSSFRLTRPKIYSRNSANVSILALEVPQRRGRGRPRKQSTVVVDAAALSRATVFAKRSHGGGVHTAESYQLHGHGGAAVAADRIGIRRPERHYIRVNDVVPSGCEYDLDDQDTEWLKTRNEEMQWQLEEETMERVIEELELGWSALTQPLRRLQQRRDATLYPEEMPCEICGESDTSNCNVIVLCDDCDLAVHQECYGVPHIPEGPWLCRTCGDWSRHRVDTSPHCLMCPWPRGALRKTSDHRWVHVVCAHMTSETAITFSLSDPDDLVDVCALQPERARLRCVLCRVEHDDGGGYPIQCASRLCHVAFHPLCARQCGWHIDFTAQRAFCSRHCPDMECDASVVGAAAVTESLSAPALPPATLKLRINLASLAVRGGTSEGESLTSDEEATIGRSRSGGSSQSDRHGKNGQFPHVEIASVPPLHIPRTAGEKFRMATVAPRVLIDHICTTASIAESLRRPIVEAIARYWSLKREARRGTPLLKSLQLEPCWGDSTLRVDEAEFAGELARQRLLHDELRGLRQLLVVVREREEAKRRRTEAAGRVFALLAQPFSLLLEDFVRRVMETMDPPGYFTHPVPIDQCPDYPSIVRHPMDFSTILRNIQRDRDQTAGTLCYPTLACLYADLRLMTENAKVYNCETSVFYQAAERMDAFVRLLLPVLQQKLAQLQVDGPFDFVDLTGRAVGWDGCFDWIAFERGLPDPTPVRFAASPSISSSEGGGGSGSGSVSVLKRRGRPPKNQLPTDVGVESDGELGDALCWAFVAATQSAQAAQAAQAAQSMWWPARRVDPSDREAPVVRRRMAGGERTLVQLFDASRQLLWLAKKDMRPLTNDFEADAAGLNIATIGQRKAAQTAHRAALDYAEGGVSGD